MEFYLASQSPRRIEILKNGGFRFKTIQPLFGEDDFLRRNPKIQSPQHLVKNFAVKKALSILKNGIILSADTTVYHVKSKKILHKPQNYKEAFSMLSLLSGSEHRVYTGCCLLKLKNLKVIEKKTMTLETKVFFRKLNKMEIQEYIRTYQPFDKSGSYGIQDYGINFIKKIEGCFLNVMGLPLPSLLETLENFGVFSKNRK